MQTGRAIEPLKPKTWQLDTRDSGPEGYLYYCLLCDEVLVLSKQEINPRKIWLVFDDTCPGCSFQLQTVLSCRSSVLPAGRRLLTNLKCIDPEVFQEPEGPTGYQTLRGSTLPRELEPSITTGVEAVDKILVLKKGQFAYLQGEQSHALSLLLSVKATIPAPEGLDSDVVFIDAGNLFDSYAIGQHGTSLGLEHKSVEKRIHLSRAFTHHQVYNLIMDKLVPAVDKYKAQLAIVSDITALFCDPDVRDKKESLDIFRRSLRFLADTAQRRNIVVLATNLKTRNKTMEEDLNQTAHISARLRDDDTYAELKLTRHPFTPERTDGANLDNKTLPRYFR